MAGLHPGHFFDGGLKWPQRSVCSVPRPAYQRITLDGAPAEVVEPKPRDLATKRLAELAAGKAAKAAAKSVRPALVEAKPAPVSPAETPEQLRARVRASLLRRSA